MYKLIIIDDEKNIREGIKQYICNNDIGYEIVGVFEDGKYALDYINHNEVDTIITDVKMLCVSGLDVAKYVYDNGLNIKVIIVSGYDDFDYAREAIQYQVHNYLLKPTDLGELNAVLLKVKEELDRMKKQQMRDGHYDMIVSVLFEELFVDLISHSVKNVEELKKRIHMLGLDYIAFQSNVFIADIYILNFPEIYREWKYGKDEFYFSIKNFLEQHNSKTISIFHYSSDENCIKVVCFIKNDYDSATNIEHLKMHLDMLVSSFFNNFKLEINYKLLSGFDTIYDMLNNCTIYKNEDYSIENDIIQRVKMLITHVNFGNKEKFRTTLDGLCIAMMDLSLNQIKVCIACIFDFFNEFHIMVELANSDRVLCESNKDEIILWIESIFLSLFEANLGNTNLPGLIKKAQEFMRENFNNDILVEDVAKHVYVHPAYLSRYFKEITGEKLHDYLVRLKMDYAKDCLQKGLNVEEVANLCGYKSGRYFSKMFKLQTGYTPSEYKRVAIL